MPRALNSASDRRTETHPSSPVPCLPHTNNTTRSLAPPPDATWQILIVSGKQRTERIPGQMVQQQQVSDPQGKPRPQAHQLHCALHCK